MSQLAQKNAHRQRVIHDVKREAILMLRKLKPNLKFSMSAKMSDITADIEKRTDFERPDGMNYLGFLNHFIAQDITYPEPEECRRVPAPEARGFRAIDPEKVKPHMRQADINAGQPPMITPNGTGNYREYSKGLAR